MTAFVGLELKIKGSDILDMDPSLVPMSNRSAAGNLMRRIISADVNDHYLIERQDKAPKPNAFRCKQNVIQLHRQSLCVIARSIRVCPFCAGHLCGRRELLTWEIQRWDICLCCGQMYVYTDIAEIQEEDRKYREYRENNPADDF